MERKSVIEYMHRNGFTRQEAAGLYRRKDKRLLEVAIKAAKWAELQLSRSPKPRTPDASV